MNKDIAWKILVFTILSYVIALMLDIAVAWFNLPVFLWGFTRMWSVTLSVLICLRLYRESVSKSLKEYLGLSKNAIIMYLVSPILVYSALGLYVVLASLLGFFDFNEYIEVIVDAIRATNTTLSEEQVVSLATISAYMQLILAYPTALTINALSALGEEIGWRGYLYDLLGGNPNLKNTVIIGVLWGLWHASAIILLGYNYQVNRYLGVLLFTLLTTVFTLPHLLVTRVGKSVLPAASLHGAINALWGLTIVASSLPLSEREVLGGLGALGIASWLAISIVVYIILLHVIKPREAQRVVNTSS